MLGGVKEIPSTAVFNVGRKTISAFFGDMSIIKKTNVFKKKVDFMDTLTSLINIHLK